MKVFKACMTVVKRRIASFVLYYIVFITLSVVMTALSADQFTVDFSVLKPNFTIINRDRDAASGGASPGLIDGLYAYLREHGNEVVLEDDKRTLQDATFYRATDYIIFLPQGFRESFLSGGSIKPETVTTTDSAKGYYADSLVNQYLNQANAYLTAGEWDEEALVSAVLSDLSLEAAAEKKRFGESAPIDLSFLIFNQMMVYILLVLNILCVTNITMVFRRPDIRMRNLCAPLKPRSQGGQQILCCGIMSVLAWLLLTATGFILYGPNLAGADGRIIALLLLNSLVFTVVALAFAALIGSFANSPNAQHAAANVGALGLCFLGGVFVPLDMLGPGVLAVAKFLPTYWNVTAQESISSLTSFDAGALLPIRQSFLIQLAFAAAFLCAAFLLNKRQNRSERSFGSVRTELEA